jgi:hypothetical protein
MNTTDALATGVALTGPVSGSFAATQGAWRFYANPDMTLPKLAEPLRALACQQAAGRCQDYVPVILDWSNLHFEHHSRKRDRKRLGRAHNLGYKLLTALAIGDRDGVPLAPVCLELENQEGTHSTRREVSAPAMSSLDSLDPVMASVLELPWPKPVVFIIDREADSVAHYRNWAAAGRHFVVRADKERLVTHRCREVPLGEASEAVKLRWIGPSTYQGKPCQWYVGQTSVVLTRPAREHRVVKGKKRHRNVPGPALALRLVVSELRDESGKVLARWLLFSNVPASVPAEVVALWYLFRWKIESYHKLLKSGGLNLESWGQETAAALSKRLLVAAMAVALAWQLSVQESPEAERLRALLMRLSGRQVKRGPNRPRFTIPALAAGLGVLLPMLQVLQEHSPKELRALLRAAIPFPLAPERPGFV